MNASDRHVRLIVNGKAAASPALREAVAVLRAAGNRMEVRVTWEGGDAARYAGEAVRDQVQVIAAAGGDGTVSEVVNGMLQADVGPESSLAIVPFGTANDFAQGCGVPLGDPLAALKLAVELPPTPIDVGKVNDRYFINVASGGFGAEVTSRTPAEMKRLLGGAAYSLMGLVTAAKMTPYDATLHVDDARYRGNLLVLAVGNGRQAGGGFPVTPNALLNDGLLDLMIVHDVDVAEFGKLLSELSDMTDESNKYVNYRQVPEFYLRSERPLQLNLDGEPISATEFQFEALPQRLGCILPASAPLQDLADSTSSESDEADQPAPFKPDAHTRMVQLGSLENPAIAELVRLELQEAGIHCHLEGLHQAGLSGVLPIRLFVAEPQLEAARKIAQQHAGNL